MKYIMIFGSIGVGKTTIGKILENSIKEMSFVPEKLENNIYLERFYKNMKKYAFKSTIEMLSLMANSYDDKNSKELLLIDNGLEELICYNRYMLKEGLLDNDEFNVYLKAYNAYLKLLPKTDLYIYCFTDINTQLARIKERGRNFESSIDKDLLCKLNSEYEKFVQELPSDLVMYVDTTNTIDVSAIEERIKKIL